MRAHIAVENIGEGLWSGPVGEPVDAQRDHELQLTVDAAERWAPTEWDDAQVVNVLIPDDLLTASARVLHVIADPEFAQHDGADPWLVGSTLEPDIPRTITDHIIDLLCREGHIERFHLAGVPGDEAVRLRPVPYEEA